MNEFNFQATTGLADLKTLFISMKECFYFSKILELDDLKKAMTPDIQLPPLDGGVNFDSGAPDKTDIKLVSQEIWATKVTRGNSDISFQWPTINDKVMALLLNKIAAATGETTELMKNRTFEINGYNFEPKRVQGSLLFSNDTRDVCIVMPNVEIYSSMQLQEGDAGQHVNSTVTPLKNADEVELFVLTDKGGVQTT